MSEEKLLSLRLHDLLIERDETALKSLLRKHKTGNFLNLPSPPPESLLPLHVAARQANSRLVRYAAFLSVDMSYHKQGFSLQSRSSCSSSMVPFSSHKISMDLRYSTMLRSRATPLSSGGWFIIQASLVQ